MTTHYGSGARKVKVSSADRMLFPDDGLTKGDIVGYYAAVAERMVPHMKGRPVTMLRAPEGIRGGSFFQQSVPGHFPHWIQRARLERIEGGTVDHPVCDSMTALVYMANQGCLTFHTWLSRVDEPRKPDMLIFDLDPSDDDFEKVRAGAFIVKEALERLGLAPFVKTTGSRGVHIVTPLRREEEFDPVREFAGGVARHVAAGEPELLTMEQRKAKRGSRVYVDILRNSYGQSAIAPYSVRLKPGAPVSAPITWDELEDRRTGPQTFRVEDALEKLNERDDPWKGMSRKARSLSEPREKLRGLLERVPESSKR